MQVKPNKTVVRGVVRDTRAPADGVGEELDLAVGENRSKEGEDFIQPKAGASLTVFSADATRLKSGDHVEAELTLLAGPFGERVVSQRIRKLKR